MYEPDDSIDPAANMSPLLRGLAARGTVERYAEGSLLIREGDRGDALYIVLRGSVKVFSTDSQGREVTYGDYSAGEYLGEMCLDGGLRSASVVTLEPTLCAIVKRDALRKYLVDEPEFAFELLERLIRRVRVLTDHTRGLALLRVYPRLIKVLEDLSTPAPGGGQIIVPRPTHKSLASRIGASREMVSRLIKDLQQGGHLVKAGQTFLIPNKLPSKW